jgi:hypothetical protein
VLVKAGEEVVERIAPHVEEALKRRSRGEAAREILRDALRKLEETI